MNETLRMRDMNQMVKIRMMNKYKIEEIYNKNKKSKCL